MIFIKRVLLLLKSLLLFIPYKLIDKIIIPSSGKSAVKNILIIKLDEIGDYFLFRNFLSFVKKSEMIGNYKIIFCGNIAWKNLAENLDKDSVDEFIWLNKKKFSSNLFYRHKFLKQVSEKSYGITINAAYSRSYYLDDAIISKVNSQERIGFKTDLSNSYKWQVNLSNKYYTRLINTEEEIFDFNKNKIFFEKFLKIQIPIIKPSVNADKILSDFTMEGDYVVFFAGGRRKYKIWNLNNFIKLGEYLISNYNLKIVLTGTSAESKINKEFIDKINLKEFVIDTTGQTSLIDVLKVLSNARLLVTNDSGIVHSAASVATPVIVLANGTHYGRFIPYPKGINDKVVAIFPPGLNKENKSKNFSDDKFKYRSHLDINSIDYETVREAVNKILSK